MSVHLVGGGGDPAHDAEVFGSFLSEVTKRAAQSGRDEPLVAIVTVGPGTAHAEELAESLGGSVQTRRSTLAPGDIAALTAISAVDGILIGGGVTPDYLAALLPIFGEIRRQISAGVPYLGFSAGAMIAAERALIGGWRIGGVEVTPEHVSEGLDEITLAQGIGLLDVTVDVHAAQSGSLSRLIAATEAGLIDGGLAIDEDTVLVVGEGALGVLGAGSVWRVSQADGGVLVSTIGA
ncbi:Type 1 glutamine amidotransferase-like domain-containing protein [Cryobacterium sp. PH29-G1]|uniref:Type 1 glutamine amidotransferase-like domain-containing protein n=1 Tax=Cryobacterium sp. PH29-G1 TaxID=3046211 RepID=UPI0024BB563F|nr:Type 1 glutamine amidotransferase-like domain-containing protein [Cryobacterium sp. PH29-G1]MDJ0349833.1 Type 1 glutamine amidotransferase-like domain-containing protein [Cryobacterium sp. PH29-G1]